MIELRTGVYTTGDSRPDVWVIEQKGAIVAFTDGGEVEEVPVGQLAAYLERNGYQWTGQRVK